MRFLCSTVSRQNQTSPDDGAPQANGAKSAAPDKAAKVITNETRDGQGACPPPAQSTKDATPEDALRTAFLHRIAGRWNLAYSGKGNHHWWPNHGSAGPKNQIHYLFGPTELSIESRPEFNPTSVTGRFVYGSVRKISADVFDVALYKPCEPATQEIKRFKLSINGKMLEITADAEGNPEPTIQVLELVEPSFALPQEPTPKVKSGEIKEGKQYTSSKEMFSITVPPRNWAVDTYKFEESQLKYENYDYEEVDFYIPDFGQAYGAGVRRIPQAALIQMAKEEEKQTLSNLANKALH